MCSSLLNLKLVIAYDGSRYLGWQKTPLGPSIEGCLQTAIQKILQHDITLQAASRTDAGVHAQRQVVNFFTSKEIVSEFKLLLSINGLLPKDIRIVELTETNFDFHPTLDCIGKTYHYELCQGPIQLPHYRNYSWHVPYKLNLAAMKEAADFLIGNYDFSAFCNIKTDDVYKDKIRHLQEIKFIEPAANRLQISLTGKNFLYRMARNLVGTLVQVGIGRIAIQDIPSILQNKDRRKAGVSAPAYGLTLFDVHYK